MDCLKQGFEVFKRNPIEWTIVGLLYGALQMTGIGTIFLGNFIRMARKSGETGASPEISELFQFDHIADDVVTLLLVAAASVVGLAVCGIGAIIAGYLTFWAMHLNADGLFTPVDCIKASFHHAKSNLIQIFITTLVLGLCVGLGTILTCGLGAMVATPILILSFERFYAANREDILATAATAGVLRKV